MNVFLVHHAEAVPPGVDAQRPLTARGLEQASWLAAEAKRLGVAPATIWHSGKLRARQTGEAMLLGCVPFARFQMVRGLAPEDSVEWIADALEAEDEDVMLVGHMPHLPALVLRLCASAEMFPLHGLVWLTRTGPRRYEQRLQLQPP